MWTNSSQASISIHALREEGDYNPFVHTCFFGYFYPRPPRGGRLVEFCQLHQPVVFLSTPSARRATHNTQIQQYHQKFLSTPSARRATKIWGMGNIIIAISIHALREEGDSACPALVGSAQEFLSTPSARRATKPRRRERSRQNISIHALREEGDAAGDGTGRRMGNFYPRPPRGGRPTHSQL